MTIDLRELVDKLPYPKPPSKKKWSIFAFVLIILIVLFLLVFLNDTAIKYSTLTWVFIIVFPILIVGLVYGIRLFIYEQRCSYVQAWNEQHDKTEAELIYVAQQYITLIDHIYMVDNICNNINDISTTLGMADKLFTFKLPKGEYIPIKYTRIDSFSGELEDRIRQAFAFIFSNFKDALKDIIPSNDVNLIISVNTEVNDYQSTIEEILGPYKNTIFTNYYFTNKNEGLFFLDEWLDSRESKYQLYCEITLREKPLVDSGEFISLFLLNYTDKPSEQNHIAIHRPVKKFKDSDSIEYALKTALEWGDCQEQDLEYIWFAGLPYDEKVAILLLIDALEFSITVNNTVDLNLIFGNTGNSSGALALSAAIEQTKKSQLPQLVIYKTDSLQMLIVKSVSNNPNNNQEATNE